QARGEADAAGSGPLPGEDVPDRDLGADAPADLPRRHDDRPADLPADGPRVQRARVRSVTGAPVAEHVLRRAAGRSAGGVATPELDHPGRFRAAVHRRRDTDRRRATRRLRAVAGTAVAGRGMRPRPPRLAV